MSRDEDHAIFRSTDCNKTTMNTNMESETYVKCEGFIHLILTEMTLVLKPGLDIVMRYRVLEMKF